MVQQFSSFSETNTNMYVDKQIMNLILDVNNSYYSYCIKQYFLLVLPDNFVLINKELTNLLFMLIMWSD